MAVIEGIAAIEALCDDMKSTADSGDHGFWKAEEQVEYQKGRQAVERLRALLPEEINTNCIHCGQPMDSDRYCEETKARLKAAHSCHSCDFWVEKAKDRHVHALISKEWSHMVAEPGVHKGVFLGCGGQAFRIVKTDGSSYVSNSVWHQGRIPEHLRYLFEPNLESMTSC